MSRGRIEQAKGGTNESFLPRSFLGSVVLSLAQSFLPRLSHSSLGSVVPPSAQSFLPWLSRSSLGSVVPPSAQSFLPRLSRSSLSLFVIPSAYFVGSQNEGTQSAPELLVTKIV